MPEVVTKHPQVVKEVLESAGARCGVGAPQEILKDCPRERFCALPGGEICVFSVDEIASMTQLSRADLCQAQGTAAPRDGPASPPAAGPTSLLAALALAAVLVLRRRVRTRRDGRA